MSGQRRKKITTASIKSRKVSQGAEKIVAVTAYDFTFAKLVEELVDVLLVGDSLGMVVQGKRNTLSVTIDDIIYHTRAVAQAVKSVHLVADMPFMSYQTGIADAVRNAGRLLAEGCAEAVKLEGGTAVVDVVAKLVHVGVPVLGHVGLTPQSVHLFGGFKVQGKTEEARNSILQDALALEDAGVYGVVLEGIPSDLGREITERLTVPTIGIGAGPNCDGQILVTQDILGMNPDFQPRFAKQYANIGSTVRQAVKSFANEVHEGQFPDRDHSFQ